MSTKICGMCKQDLPLDVFPTTGKNSYKNSRLVNLPTHESRCRPCKAEYARAWRKQAATNYRGTGKMKSIPEDDRLLVSAISERLTQAKERAKKYAQIEPDVDRDYLYQLYKDQDGKCSLSGVMLKVEKQSVTCLSLDKIKPEQGYIKGNVQWVAWAVNRAKGDMDEAVFIDMCRQILDYQKVQRLSKGGES
jgi:hypothetical protein